MRYSSFLAVPLLTFGLLSSALADMPLTYQRIDFSTQVDRTIPNDQLNATLSVEVNDKDAGKLSRQITLILNDAMKTAASYPTVKTTTGNQRTWPIYGSTLTSSSKLESWRGRAEIRLESKDFKAASELIGKLQGKLQVNGINFSVSPDTRRQVENDLTAEAVASFRSRAETLQTAWAAKSYKLVQMNLGSAGNPVAYAPMMMRAAKMMDSAESISPEFAEGETRLMVNVSGTIELQP